MMMMVMKIKIVAMIFPGVTRWDVGSCKERPPLAAWELTKSDAYRQLDF